MAQETINKCTVSGYITNTAGASVESEAVTFNLSYDTAKYGDNTAIKNVTQTATTDSDGFFTIGLVENDSMGSGAFYTATINTVEYRIKVPNESTADFWELVNNSLRRV